MDMDQDFQFLLEKFALMTTNYMQKQQLKTHNIFLSLKGKDKPEELLALFTSTVRQSRIAVAAKMQKDEIANYQFSKMPFFYCAGILKGGDQDILKSILDHNSKTQLEFKRVDTAGQKEANAGKTRFVSRTLLSDIDILLSEILEFPNGRCFILCGCAGSVVVTQAGEVDNGKVVFNLSASSPGAK